MLGDRVRDTAEFVSADSGLTTATRGQLLDRRSAAATTGGCLPRTSARMTIRADGGWPAAGVDRQMRLWDQISPAADPSTAEAMTGVRAMGGAARRVGSPWWRLGPIGGRLQ